MKRFVFMSCVGLLVWLASGALALAAESSAPLPASDFVVSNVVQRASDVATQKSKRYFYVQTSVTEQLNDKGEIKESKEKVYEVILSGGAARTHLIKVNGKPLEKSESKDADAKDREERQRVAQEKGDKKEARQDLSTAELASRFVFTLTGREIKDGRPTLMLTFVPKKGLPTKKLVDRLVNKLTGTLWVDEQDFEVAQLDVRLGEKISMWGGIIGTLDDFRLTLDRCRAPEGVWFNRTGSFSIVGRKLFSTMHFRTRDESSGFRLLEEEK